MRRTTAFVLIYDALLRPTRFLAFLEQGRRAVMLAIVVTFALLLLTLGGLVVGLSLLGALDLRSLLLGTMLAVVMIMLLSIIASMSLAGRSTSRAYAFGMLRCGITTLPCVSLVLSMVFHPALAGLQANAALIVLLSVLFGIWCGGVLNIIVLINSTWTRSAAIRWICIGSSLGLVSLLWASATGSEDRIIYALLAIGVMLGLIRPLSLLWQGLLSCGLAVGQWIGIAAHRLLSLHPAYYDELSLLPLPGLRTLLVRACAEHITYGGQAILRVAQHPAQGGAARAAVAQVMRQQRHTHDLLFWLSTRAEGIALLTHIQHRASRPQPLIDAYVAFATVGEAEVWPKLIAEQRAAIASGRALPGGEAMSAFLSMAHATLTAERWATARVHLQPAAADKQDDSITKRGTRAAMSHVQCAHTGQQNQTQVLWTAGALLRSWACNLSNASLTDRDLLLQQLLVDLEALDGFQGWPVALSAAIGEHVLFLLAIDRGQLREWRTSGLRGMNVSAPISTERQQRQADPHNP
jgi:hypothetical protein